MNKRKDKKLSAETSMNKSSTNSMKDNIMQVTDDPRNNNLSEEKDKMVNFTVNGMTMSTTLTKKFMNRRKWVKPHNNKIYSFIPGTIRELFVKEGDNVQENERLLILEAMKMMNVITAPLNGTISKIHIAPGDKVPKGKVMVEFETG